MAKVRITARAARFVSEWAKWAEMRIGREYVPVVMWQVSDSKDPDFVPQLTLGFEKRDVVDRSRVMECDGKDVDIYQYAPDELFGEDARKFVDVRNETLVLTEDEHSECETKR
jgi:hypothetical protein